LLYSASIVNSQYLHTITLGVGEKQHSLEISSQPSGFGSSISGGELLFLALATCFCNDVYREASKFGVKVQGIEVEVIGDFQSPGLPAQEIQYRVKLFSDSPSEDIQQLLKHTDEIAEIQQTVRRLTPVILDGIEIVSA
jgi:uncharacterized OsmC-like protein